MIIISSPGASNAAPGAALLRFKEWHCSYTPVLSLVSSSLGEEWAVRRSGWMVKRRTSQWGSQCSSPDWTEGWCYGWWPFSDTGGSRKTWSRSCSCVYYYCVIVYKCVCTEKFCKWLCVTRVDKVTLYRTPHKNWNFVQKWFVNTVPVIVTWLGSNLFIDCVFTLHKWWTNVQVGER